MEKSVRILLLEDAKSDVELIQAELEKLDSPYELKVAATRETFLKELQEFTPHIVLSDYTLDTYDGLSALESVLRGNPNLPFIFVSWPIHEQSLIDTMKLGATDYIFKDKITLLPHSIQRALREADERLELQKTQQRIIEQERLGALGQMASGIAHDFGNALTPVLGYSELLLNYPENMEDREKLTHFLKMINLTAKDAMSLVGRLREFYRPRKKVESFEALDLKKIVEESISLTNPRWGSQAQAMGVTYKMVPDLHDIPMISGNESALREVMTNLIFNALDAMPQGGSLFFKSYQKGNFGVLEVTDTGMGMSEDVRRHCFDPFFSTKGQKGSGLGLAMVYGVIRRHEGSIEILSEQGKGSTFVLRLPVHTGLVRQTSDPLLVRPARPARPLHFLVVDDEPMVRDVLREYLIGDGHTTEMASDGSEGFEKFSHGKFDLVVTDWAMPGMSGDKLAIKIKEMSALTPIILLTGFGELMKAKGDHPTGIDVILSKPPTLDSVREAVLKVYAPLGK
jgi:signal transduction histidine kinase